MINPKDIIAIGTLTRTHGKAGEVQCHTINTYWEDADATFILLKLNQILVPFRAIDWRCKGEDILFTLRDINTEEQALKLIGSEVYMLRSDIVQADDSPVLCWQDIVGYTINNCPIIDIDDSTPNILASMADGRLIPLHEDLIEAIDPIQKTITMNLPEGL